MRVFFFFFFFFFLPSNVLLPPPRIYVCRYKKIASMSTVPWDKAWAVDIVDLKVTKGSGRAHRLIIDGRLDDASTDLDLDAETAGYVIGLGCTRGVLACVCVRV